MAVQSPIATSPKNAIFLGVVVVHQYVQDLGIEPITRELGPGLGSLPVGERKQAARPYQARHRDVMRLGLKGQ